MEKILRFKGNENGQSLVEFALVLPMLIALILGTIEFGWILNRQITLTNLAREGARAAVVCKNETEAYNAITGTIAKSSLTEAKVNDSEFTNSWSSGNAKVILSAEIKPIVGFIDTNSSGNVTLRATSVMRKEN